MFVHEQTFYPVAVVIQILKPQNDTPVKLAKTMDVAAYMNIVYHVAYIQTKKIYYKVSWEKHQKHSMSCSLQWQIILNSAWQNAAPVHRVCSMRIPIVIHEPSIATGKPLLLLEKDQLPREDCHCLQCVCSLASNVHIYTENSALIWLFMLSEKFVDVCEDTCFEESLWSVHVDALTSATIH